MTQVNVSEWGLRHPQLVFYLIAMLTLVGLFAYRHLGQSEDPPFTFRVMVVTAQWPGATATEVATQVTDKIEKTLRQMGEIETLQSFSRPGYSQVIVRVRESLRSSELQNIWYRVRKRIGDIQATFPGGVSGPYFNDEFGDTYGNIFALTGDGMSYARLKEYAEAIRHEFMRIPDVAKVEFFGEQEQRVFIEFSPPRMAALGIDPSALASAIAAQNAKVAGGYFELVNERIFLRPQGDFLDLEAIRALPLRAAGRTIRLGDIASVRRGYVDPPQSLMRFMGTPAFGIGVSMQEGGDIIALGRHLDQAVGQIERQLPVGLELSRVADQPRAVSASVHDFVKSLTEAVAIVLAVSLLSLGLRTGVVVAISIPVVLAITFLLMYLCSIGLHKISLGALILALGLLVDDAIIAVEMMATKMEQGWERVRAAAFAYTSTAQPMLAGTLVTAAGFLPIATARSTVGEYTRSLFEVTVIALLTSWVAAVLFVPFLGYYLLPDFEGQSGRRRWLVRILGLMHKRGGAGLRAGVGISQASATDIYATPFYCSFRRVVEVCVRRRWLVIGATLAVFALALWGFRYIPRQFFPDSIRPELLVDIRLQQGASFEAVNRSVHRLERYLSQQQGVENYVSYIGTGSPRFYLPLDQQLPQTNFAQLVILTTGIDAREALRQRLIDLFNNDFAEFRASINRLETGPPVGFPVQYRVSGPDPVQIQAIGDQIASLMRNDDRLSNVQKDWEEASKVVRIRVDPEKARMAGMSRQEVQAYLATALNGRSVTQFREKIETISVDMRAARQDVQLSYLPDMIIPNGTGQGVPLSQIATFEYGFEPGLIWRRNRVPTVTVRANLYGHSQPSEVVAALMPAIRKIQEALPLGYHIETGGAVEESSKGNASVAEGMPLFVIAVLTILMFQLQDFSRMAMVVLTAPLGIIGVTLALLVSGQPFGFVAMLGSVALSGMIMRNSVILIDQIDQDQRAGCSLHEAIVESTVRRFRPIMLTALAAILAMIPLSRSVFFGPMAVAIMGGLLGATLLTLLFLPALYAAWYRVSLPGNR